jgi:hypothetical protein
MPIAPPLAYKSACSTKQLEAQDRLCLQKEVGDLKSSLTPAPGAGLR